MVTAGYFELLVLFAYLWLVILTPSTYHCFSMFEPGYPEVMSMCES